MLAKKTTASLAVLAAALVVSAPALADRGPHRDHRYVQYYHVKHRPVVHHYHYRPAPLPRRVVVHAPPPPPAVVYHQQVHPRDGAAIVVGAVLGAAILHHVITGY